MAFSKGILTGAAEMIVLHSLNTHSEAYGYELIKLIRQESDDIFQFEEGTLYPLLYRLESKEFIESVVKPAPNGKKRRYYRITDAGKGFLVERKAELKTFYKGLEHVLNATNA